MAGRERESTSGSAAVTVIAPAAPTGLTGSEDSSGYIDLSWTDNAANADSDEILTSLDDTNFTPYDTVAAASAGSTNTYSDTAPTDGSPEYYEVEATDGNIESAPSNIFSFTPIAPPTAQAQTYSVLHGQTLSIAAGGLLAGAAGSAPGDTLTVAGANGTPQATNDGTVTINADGSFEYTPDAGYVGTDSFTYSVADGSLVSQPATVTIDVTDQAPQAVSLYNVSTNNDPTNSSVAGSTVSGSPYTFGGLGASDADDDPLTFSLVNADGSALPDASGNPTPLGPFNTGHGSVTLDSSGHYTYTPDAGFIGVDRFYYVANDGAMNSNVASVSIDVQGSIPNVSPISTINDPVALDTPCVVPYYSSLFASNVDSLLFEIVTQPPNATIVPDPSNGLLTITATSAGVGTFTYSFGPDAPESTGSIDVDPPGYGTAPVWAGLPSQSYTVSHGGTLAVPASNGLLGGAYYQGDALSVNILPVPGSGSTVPGPTSGTVTYLDPATGAFDYTPAANATNWVYIYYNISAGASPARR